MDGSVTAAEGLVGRISGLSGSQDVSFVEKSSSKRSHLHVGRLVKMRAARSVVFGTVIRLRRSDEATGESATEVKIDLIGEAPVGEDGRLQGFQRGVSIFPSLGDAVYLATPEDVKWVYARPAQATVRIGAIHNAADLPAYVMVDDLLGKHFAVLGTTGAGKSCTTTLILRRILEQYQNAHVVLLDLHNEYTWAFGDQAEVLNTQSIKLPYWLFNFEEAVEIFVGSDRKDRAAEITVLSELIPAARKRFLGNSDLADIVTVDTPVPYRIGDFMAVLDEAMGRLEKPDGLLPYNRIKARLNALRSDSRFDFMFGGMTVKDSMADILSQIFRIPVDGKPITIIDMSGVPSDVINVVVSVLCRMTFDFALWHKQVPPILLVCEEAHRYAPADPDAGFGPTRKALGRIAKEGRKYGVSLCLVTQRPSELDTAILSQCGTIFALRMNNKTDQDYVAGAMPESATGMLAYLPSLRTGEAIAMGEGVSVPMRLRFDILPEDQRPMSWTAPFSEAWQDDITDTDFIGAVVERWRFQGRGGT